MQLVELMQLVMSLMLVAVNENKNAKFAIDDVEESNTMYGKSTAEDDEKEYVMPRKRPRSS